MNDLIVLKPHWKDRLIDILKIIIFKKIEYNNNLRQTSLQDAVKDIYVCAAAKYFMRSPGSFSDNIIHLRNLSN